LCQPLGEFIAENPLSPLKELMTMHVTSAVWGNYCGLISFSAFIPGWRPGELLRLLT